MSEGDRKIKLETVVEKKNVSTSYIILLYIFLLNFCKENS